MEGFTWIDGAVLGVILLSALLAYARGFVREALAIGGWIVATIAAFVFADSVTPLIAQVPVVGDFIGDSCELSVIAAFAAVFALALVIMSIFVPLFASMVQRSALSGIDQGLGFLFGVARGVLLIAVAFFVYQTALSADGVAVVDDSRSAQVFRNITNQVAERDPQAALGWVTTQYEQLVGSCGTEI